MSTVATRPQIGFLGVGWIGQKRLEAIAASGVAEVAALADPAVEGALASLDELMEAELDGVVIATPSAMHAEQAVAALERGMAVFCQKPLALDAATAAQVVAAARAADRLLAVDFCYRSTAAARRVKKVVEAGDLLLAADFCYRFTEAARCVKRLADAGELGNVFAVDLVFHNAYGPDKPWFSNPELSGGGCVIDLGIHLIDLALWTLGFPQVASITSRLRGRPLEDYASVQIELETSVVLRLTCSWRLHAGRACVLEASFYGTRGGASLRNVDGSFYDFVAERFAGTSTEVLATPPDDWGGRAAVAWAQRVREGVTYDPAAEGYVRVHEVIDRIYARTA